MKFEEGLADLEGIVERLEAAELPLEEALALFEKGIGLVRGLTKQLDEVEKKLEVLTKNAVGEAELRELRDPSRDAAADDSEEPRGDE
jgi:exodeoxyribonuclease VII small subunit